MVHTRTEHVTLAEQDRKKEFLESKIDDTVPQSWWGRWINEMVVCFRGDQLFVKNLVAESGQFLSLTPTQTQGRPQRIQFTRNAERLDKDYYYHIICVDLDAPVRSEPQQRSFLHWMLINMKPMENNLYELDMSQGDEVCEWMPPAPPANTGRHRYVFMLFRSSDALQYPQERRIGHTTNGRGKFDVHEFAKNNQLTFPVSYAAFEAEFDTSVPEVHKSFQATFSDFLPRVEPEIRFESPS